MTESVYKISKVGRLREGNVTHFVIVEVLDLAPQFRIFANFDSHVFDHLREKRHERTLKIIHNTFSSILLDKTYKTLLVIPHALTDRDV